MMKRICLSTLILILLVWGCQESVHSLLLPNVFGSDHSLEIVLPFSARDSTYSIYRGGHPPSKKTIHQLDLFRKAEEIATLTISFQELTPDEVGNLISSHYSETSKFNQGVDKNCLLFKSTTGDGFLLAKKAKIDSSEGSIFFEIVTVDSSILDILFEACSNSQVR